MMRWESVHINARAKDPSEGRRFGGRWGPGKRWGHTCNAVRGGRLLYVFGGYGCDNSQTNDVHVFDTVKQTWSKPMMKGTPPSPRDSHSCTTVGDRLFVFGGTDGTNPLKDLHVLDTSSNTWIVPAVTGEGPDAREGHSATLVDKRLFIFGGCGKSSDTHQELYYNDLFILDTEILTWEHAMTSGTPPCPRDSHTCSSWKKKIIVLGGEDSSDCYLSDVHMLDAATLVWKQVNTSGMLAPRAGHTTVGLGSNLFVFGGFTDSRNLYDDLHVLNVDSSTWSRVVTVNQGPSARFSVAGDCLDVHKGIIVFTGGCNKSLEALDDMYYLHTGMLEGNGLHEVGMSFPRSELSKCREPEKINNVNRKSDSSHSVYLQACSQSGIVRGNSSTSGEVAFEARITEINQFGYTIETVINGKLLRGMLFSSLTNFDQDNPTYPNKRRMRTDIEGTKLNEHQPSLKETKTPDQEHISGAYVMESKAQAPPVEVLATTLPKSIANAGVYQQKMVSENVEPSLVVTPTLTPVISTAEMMNASANSNPSPMHMKNDSANLSPPGNWNPSNMHMKNDSEDREPLPVHLKNDSEGREPPTMHLKNTSEDKELPQMHLKNDPEDINLPQMHPKNDSEDIELPQMHLKNDSEDIELPQMHLKNDSEDIEPSPILSEDLMVVSEKTEPPPMVPDVQKNDESFNEPHRIVEETHGFQKGSEHAQE